MTQSKIDGQINISDIATNPEGIVDGKNFEWKTPSVSIAFGVSPVLSKTLKLLFDVDLNNSDKLKISSLNTGFGLVVMNDVNHKLRLDLGLNFHSKNFVWYSSETAIVQSDGELDFDPFISLMYNTDIKEWLINPFINLYYTKQTLLDNQLELYLGQPYKNIDVFVITTGLYFNFNDNNALSLGISLNYIVGIQNTYNLVFIPHLQYNYFWGR